MARASTSGRSRSTSRTSGRGGRGTPSGVVGFWTRPESNRFFLILGFVVRHRAEIAVLTVGYLIVVQLTGWFTPVPSPSIPGHPAPAPVSTGLSSWFTPDQWAWIVVAATLVVVMAIPASRRYTWGRCRAVIVRHRMRACFVQTRTWTTNGRLPFCVWSRPSPVGERVRVWLPAGLSVKHLERIQTELASACWAREVRLLPVRSQAALVVVDVVRRDPLGSRQVLAPPVVDDVDTTTGINTGINTDSGVDVGSSGRPDWLPAPSQIDDTVGSGWTAVPPPLVPPLPPPVASSGSTQPSNGTRGTRKSGTGEGADQVDKPVTGFGGVDVSDYI